MKLIYIGFRFYNESDSLMSSIYTEDGKRSDWGKVQLALEAGNKVEIRPASLVELSYYESCLSSQKKNGITGGGQG